MNSVTVGAVIVDYYTSSATGQLVRDLLEDGGLSEIIVVDNTGDEDYNVAVPPGVVVVKAPARGGYGHGMNRGVRQSRSDYLVLLNSDIRVRLGHVSMMTEPLASDPRAGLVSPLIEDMCGGVQPDAGGAFLRRWWGKEGLPTGAYWRTGAALGVRRSDFLRWNGFDPAYFMYWEDVDLCRRVWLDGMRVVDYHSVVLTHESGASDGSVVSRYRRAAISRDLYLKIGQYPLLQRLAFKGLGRLKLAAIRMAAR